ncbi:MAG: hypothetical protein Q9195_002754 [Heterodermia aff. obscurata]
MTSINRRPPPPNSASSRSLNSPSSPRPPNSNRQNSSVTTADGLAHAPSLRTANGLSRPARNTAKRASPNTSFLNTNANVSDEASGDDARAEDASIIDELRDRLRKAENASEEFQRQLTMLQTRLDESLQEQGKMEESFHGREQQINDLEDEKVRLIRQNREAEILFESEREAMTQDRAEQKAKEEELTDIIRRLKAQREPRANSDENRVLSMSPESRHRPSLEMENDQFAPPLSLQRNDSNTNVRSITQKDKLIESLQLELAGAHIKLVELENKGGGREHELEKTLLETRITNARLMEDNESFQLLLSEKTLNGDFSKTDVMHSSSGLGSLAEELESAEGESENYRRLELEAKSLKEQNRALTLYVESIIGRLLQHKEFENILEKTPDLMSGKPRPPSPPGAKTDKELPPPPPPKDEEPQPSSLLQRARSVVAGPRRPRPMSQIFSQTSVPSALASPLPEDTPITPIENPTPATSRPPTRSQSNRNSNSHRRSQSEMPLAGAPLVNQMYRGPPSGTSSAMVSPGLSPSIASSTTARTSFFNPASIAATAVAPSSQNPTAPPSSSRLPSGTATSTFSTTRNPNSSSNSTFSSSSGPNANKDPAEISSTSSPPRNVSGGSHGPQYTGAVMTQNRLRPLRLVQENADGSEEEKEREREKARKKANRASWMPGWMGRANTTGEGGMF